MKRADVAAAQDGEAKRQFDNLQKPIPPGQLFLLFILCIPLPEALLSFACELLKRRTRGTGILARGSWWKRHEK